MLWRLRTYSLWFAFDSENTTFSIANRSLVFGLFQIVDVLFRTVKLPRYVLVNVERLATHLDVGWTVDCGV